MAKSRKKKEKRTVFEGKVYIQATFNNTIVTVTDLNGNGISWASAGSLGFRGAKKSTPYAAQTTAESAQSAAKTSTSSSPSIVVMRGYLDDLSDELYAEVPETKPEEETQEATKMAKDQIDRYGPGNWDDFVEFHEFDGGDGQMGVAGDGYIV